MKHIAHRRGVDIHVASTHASIARHLFYVLDPGAKVIAVDASHGRQKFHPKHIIRKARVSHVIVSAVLAPFKPPRLQGAEQCNGFLVRVESRRPIPQGVQIQYPITVCNKVIFKLPCQFIVECLGL